MEPSRAARTTVILAALFALFFPSSIGGVISTPLARVAIVLNVVVFAALLLGRCRGSRLQAIVGLAMIAWLSALTLFAPQTRLAPGIVTMFSGLALMFATNARAVIDPQGTKWTLAGINIFALTVGTALAFDIQLADRFIKTHYAAFYPGLLVSMLDWHDKPVLTLATHSIAGFFYYLFFYLNFRTYVVTGSRVALVAATGHIALGLALRSTTGWILMTVAAVQLVVALWRRHGRQLAWVPVLAPVLLVGVVVLEMERLAASVAPVRDILIGTPASGLLARYSASGMLGGNLRYLRDSPFSPLGFNYSLDQDLFYGDSGLIQFMLRGSFPLVLLVYGGLYGFLRGNLRNRSDFGWLYVVTLAFELGIVSLFSWRFTSFLPFMIVYLNSLGSQKSSADARIGDHAQPAHHA